MRIAFLAFLPSLLFSQSPNPARDSSASLARDLVNPFIGTGGHGHTFPGACVPNGLVQLSPDTRPDGVMDWDGCGGYHYSDSLIYGFSHTHLSGTGVADLCDVLLMPMSGAEGEWFLRYGYRQIFDHKLEQAHAGYYKVRLKGTPSGAPSSFATSRAPLKANAGERDIDVELTATKRVGVHRYSYQPGQTAQVVLDLFHRDELLAGSINTLSATEVVGERRSSSWARDQRLYFCIRFSAPIVKEHVMPSNIVGKVAAYDFGPLDRPLIVKVGISAVSIEGARANLDAEVPGWDFDAVRKQAEDAWNAKLNKIQVEGGTKEQQRIFYTALYHCYVAPYIFNDVDGHYRGMDGEVHHADHNVYTVFSLWDTFRALHPLMTILEPEMTSDFIKTFLLHYQQGGRLPVWELWGNETDCMIGYHSVSVIADAYMKGIRGFDAELALEAMVASAMRDEPGLNAYRAKGYISSEDQSESVSKTLEYAYDDWCIASFRASIRQGDGSEDDMDLWETEADSLVSAMSHRSYNWLNLLDPRTGFFRARRNGGFIDPFDPSEVNFNYTEANAWQYAFGAMHAMGYYDQLLGTRDSLEGRLDRLFSAGKTTTGREQADITGLIGQYAHGNEPDHHVPFLYCLTEHPEKTGLITDRIMREFYHDTPDGLIGNEDCGQMSAWYVFTAMGLYPVVPGSPQYWVFPSVFDRIEIELPGGNQADIRTRREGQDPHFTTLVGKLGYHAPSPRARPTVFSSNSYYLEDPESRMIDHDDLFSNGGFLMRLVEDSAHYRGWRYLTGRREFHGVGIPTVPIITARSRTFPDSLLIAITTYASGIGSAEDDGASWRTNGDIYYSINGPDSIFPIEGMGIRKYTGPFWIESNSTINAASFMGLGNEQRSPMVTAHFTKVDGARSITLESKYANQYSAGGDRALIDGLRGGADFRTGEWQGYQGQDVVVMIDLGKMVDLKRVGLSALQDQKSWIWLPSEVTIATSTNQRQWSSTTVTHDVDPKAEGGILRELWTGLLGRKARYIAITAKNAGPCPDWHPGKGGATWIFVDEVLIEVMP